MSSSIQIQKLTNLLHYKTINILSSQHLFQIHAQLITTGLHSNSSHLLSLFQFYISNPSTLPLATAVFDQIDEHNSEKWRILIRKHASDGKPLEAISLFREMLIRTSCRNDDPFVYASLIKACNQIGCVREGKSVHCHLIRLGLDGNINVLNSLINLYANFGGMRYACVLFDKIPDKTVVTINCMVSGYLKAKAFYLGLDLFIRASRGCFGSSARPNHVTFVILISGCTENVKPNIGTSLHCCCCKMGFESNKEICNVLIDYYTRVGSMSAALRLFDDMPEKDLVSWNTMIVSCVRNNQPKKAFSLFKAMRRRVVEIDRISLISLVSASANGEDFYLGKMIHGHIKGSGIEITVPLGTALINMYSKCKAINLARKVFDEMPKDNIASWNSMIHGFVECGLGNEALKLFNDLQSLRLKVDEVTMLGLILACRDLGELENGIQVHSYVKSNRIFSQSIVLGNALIDMYAKCGSMTRAKAVFDEMSSRDVISWTSIIMGYAMNGKGEEALATYNQMISEKILPNAITFIAVLSACNHAGLVDYGQALYDSMQKNYNISPAIEHCGCMVDMHARGGMIEEARRFVKTMPVDPNAIIWRTLMNACKVHTQFDLGLTLINGIMKVGPEDRVVISNILAETGKWDDVLCQRSLMVVQEDSKVAGTSLVPYEGS